MPNRSLHDVEVFIEIPPSLQGSSATLLGPQSAAEDLMESFGFEGELETTKKGTPLSEFNRETG